MIRTTLILTALTGLVGLPTVASADVANTTGVANVAVDTIEGTIERVGADSFTVKVGERTHTVQIDSTTTYHLDGKASTRDLVLKKGAIVTITHEKDLASKVEAKTAK